MKPLVGTVVSTKMDKTIAVEVTSRWQHPLYKKVVKRSKRYLAHDEKEEASDGDIVSIASHQPVSKRKRWKLEQIIEKQQS